MKYIIDHIGVAVESIHEYLNGVLCKRHNIKHVSEEIIDTNQGVKLLFVEIDSFVRFELIQPNSCRSPVTRLLKEKGNPVYHIGYKVDDIDRAINLEIENGGLLVGKKQSAVAFHDNYVAFVYTKTNELIELIER